MTDPNSQMRERCDHPGLDGKFRVKAECGYCKRDAEIERLRAVLDVIAAHGPLAVIAGRTAEEQRLRWEIQNMAAIAREALSDDR